MTKEQLEFTVYCIGSVADYLGKDARSVYLAFKNSGLLHDYIIPSYDVLHTFGKRYMVEDMVSIMNKRGVRI